jgi:hypothetical protein
MNLIIGEWYMVRITIKETISYLKIKILIQDQGGTEF